MLLGKLSEEIGAELTRGADTQISGISADSKHIMQGDLFVCFKGEENDGHDFAAEAVACGAVALAVERKLDINVPQMIVPDGRRAMGELAAAFYGHPERKLKIVGITGTNGKTTTAHMLAAVFKAAGIPCGNIGTLGIFYANKEISPELTTPDPVFLYKVFADMVSSGISWVVMEVSAHALYYGKVDGIRFEYCIFTNLTEDHLDFFGTMERYAETVRRGALQMRRAQFRRRNGAIARVRRGKERELCVGKPFRRVRGGHRRRVRRVPLHNQSFRRTVRDTPEHDGAAQCV